MIPIIQFDPSSMAIWYDAHTISRMKGSSDIGKVLDCAIRDDPSIAGLLDGITDEWVKVRAGTIGAAVWHEKRHFLDFALTNYGALRLRQFFTTYLSMPGIISDAQEAGELLVPIQSYLEPTFCEINEIKPPTEYMIAVAKSIRQRKRILADDRRQINSRFGTK